MDQKRIIDRIADLLKLTGIRDQQTVEELTDHYLTHIEEEVKRGVNSQQAIRETFQEIAHLEILDLSNKKKRKNNWLFLMLLMFILISFMGIRYGVVPAHEDGSPTTLIQKEKSTIQPIDPPSGSPIDHYKIDVTSEFGFRIHPINKRKEQHRGIDIKAQIGTPVVATADGYVIDAGYEKKPGNFITLQHDGEYTTKYFHLSEILIEKDTKIEKGQVIGKVGNSGFSFRPHLHYEILKSDIPVNPRAYIKP